MSQGGISTNIIYINISYHIHSSAFERNCFRLRSQTQFLMRVGGMQRGRKTVKECAGSRYTKTKTRIQFSLIVQVASNEKDVITSVNSALLYPEVVLFVSKGCNQPL